MNSYKKNACFNELNFILNLFQFETINWLIWKICACQFFVQSLLPLYLKQLIYIQIKIFKPVHIFPSPVYPSLQVHLYNPGPMLAHVACLWQSSLSVPQILMSNIKQYLLANRKKNHDIRVNTSWDLSAYRYNSKLYDN